MFIYLIYAILFLFIFEKKSIQGHHLVTVTILGLLISMFMIMLKYVVLAYHTAPSCLKYYSILSEPKREETSPLAIIA